MPERQLDGGRSVRARNAARRDRVSDAKVKLYETRGWRVLNFYSGGRRGFRRAAALEIGQKKEPGSTPGSSLNGPHTIENPHTITHKENHMRHLFIEPQTSITRLQRRSGMRQIVISHQKYVIEYIQYRRSALIPPCCLPFWDSILSLSCQPELPAILNDFGHMQPRTVSANRTGVRKCNTWRARRAGQRADGSLLAPSVYSRLSAPDTSTK
jgi:hypothetical protein